MKILKSIAVAFSMYSRIPMPKFDWGTEDMKYHLIFFPWIGIVIGLIEYGWMLLCENWTIDRLTFNLVAVVIPLLVTGGFHLDGFMDTSDALSSWGDKEKRHEILKDSHVGAFAVIKLCILGMLLIASIQIMDRMALITWFFVFFEARALSGLSVVSMKKAKEEGLLDTEAKTASSRIVRYTLEFSMVVSSIALAAWLQVYWLAALFALLISFYYYKRTAYTKFGGITGDLAGWFVCSAEVLSAIALAILSIVFR